MGIALALDYLLAAAFYPATRRRGSVPRLILLWGLLLAIAAVPWIVPPRAKLLRFATGVWAIALMVKLYDAGSGETAAAMRLTIGQYLAHLFNGLWHVLRRPPVELRWGWRTNLLLLIRRAMGGAVALAVCVPVFRADWSGRSFWVEHAAKVIPFYFALINNVGAFAALWRLLGLTAMDPFHHPAAAATPAEFWRRWNRPTAQWFYEHVFRPAGGLANPLRAMGAAFVLSAVVHEYLFTLVVGRIQGFQMAFFLIQGAAAIVTVRVNPRGLRRIAWTVGTFTFTLITCVLFFEGINHIGPFYQRPLPGWLGAWDARTATG